MKSLVAKIARPKRMRWMLGVLVAAMVATGAMAQSRQASPGASPIHAQERSVRISIDVEGTVVIATLEDSEAAKDFASLLPLTLTLQDYAATEKVSDLPRRLTTAGAAAAISPQAGDVAYYAPWGNLAIFHKGFRHSPGLVKLGTLDAAGIEVMRRTGPLRVTLLKTTQ